MSLTSLTGILLVAGALLFWSSIVAAVIHWRRTGTLPFQDPSSVPPHAFYQSIHSNPHWWKWVNILFTSGILTTVLGFTALTALLQASAQTILAYFAWTAYLLASFLWLILFSFNLSISVWGAHKVAATNSVPPSFEAWPTWQERLVHLYMTLAYFSIAFYGGAILATRILPSWAGWLSLLVGLCGAASIVLAGSSLAIPLLIHIIPAIVGLLLLLGK